MCSQIRYRAFGYCSSLSIVNVPLCSFLGSSTFQRCSSLLNISLSLCASVYNYTFQSCVSLSNADFSICTYIGSYAFYGCSSLSTVSFPMCETIRESAFYGCSSLLEASFPECKTIWSSAFAYCSSLIEASFPECDAIGAYAFGGCNSLRTIYFPEVTTLIGRACDMFAYCSSLISINLPKLTTISHSTSTCFISFPGCRSLEFISIPLQNMSIDQDSFSRCYKLKEIRLDGCVTIYGDTYTGPFIGRSELHTISFEKCTDVIWGWRFFASCSKLKNVNFPVLKSTCIEMFANCLELSTITFPELSFLAINTFMWCTSLSEVTLPKCNTIANNAFRGCRNLRRLVLASDSVVTYVSSDFTPDPWTPNAVFAYTPISAKSISVGSETIIVPASYDEKDYPDMTFGSIYVPASLIGEYQTAKFWSAYSSRFTAI